MRSDILLPATHPRRLSRTIRTAARAIFAHHFQAARGIGMRNEQAEKPDTRTQKKDTLLGAAYSSVWAHNPLGWYSNMADPLMRHPHLIDCR